MSKKKKQFAVLGLGRFGKNVALTLESMGYEVLAVDRDENIVESLSESLTRVVNFDIRDVRAFEQVGISNFDTVVISSKNLESSLMATMICEEKNIPEIVVKAIDERHAEMAKKLGATAVIFSERDTARRLALHLVSENAIDYTEIGSNINILSLKVPKKIIGKNLIQANLRSDYDVNIVAIVNKEETLVNPSPSYTFAADDKIFVLGTSVALSNFEKDMDKE